MEVTLKPWTDVDYLDFTACNEVCTKKGSKFGGPIVFQNGTLCLYVERVIHALVHRWNMSEFTGT